MLSDAYENPISTLSSEAREAYDLGVHRFLGAEPGVEGELPAVRGRAGATAPVERSTPAR